MSFDFYFMFLLQTKNLTKNFGGLHAVDHLSISIKKGLITAIIGPNGAGKSMFINILSGLSIPDEGEVMISEVRLASIKPHDLPSYGITRTFQSVRLFSEMSVLDNILVVLTERGVFNSLFERHSAFHIKKAEIILSAVGLKEKVHVLAKNLSYGQRKLLEIGRVLAMDVDFLLFDEPLAGLSRLMVEQVASIMKELRSQGRTIVLIEHDIGLIRELADYTIVMDSGHLLVEGPTSEVLERREVIEAYLGE